MTEKKKRAPKPIDYDTLLKHVHALQLDGKLALLNDLKTRIEDERKALQEQLTLIDKNKV